MRLARLDTSVVRDSCCTRLALARLTFVPSPDPAQFLQDPTSPCPEFDEPCGGPA